MSSYHATKPKSNLKFLRGGQGEKEKPSLRSGGVSPSSDMAPGIYRAVCEAARVTSKWGKRIVEMSFQVVEPGHFGVVLPGWISLFSVGDVVHPGKYTAACEAVLGRELEPGDDIDPNSIFTGKLLKVDVRFRSTDGKNRAPANPDFKKDDKDFLRVCSVLGPAEL